MSAALKGTHAQLTRLRDESLRSAEKALTEAVKARKAAQSTARRLQENQWNLAYYSDQTEGYWARQRDHDHSYLERSMLRDLRIARDKEAQGEAYLATARKAAAAVAKRERKLVRRETPGLWMLFTTCLQGWRRKRALQERRPLALHHLQ
jgi:hypothetical protein